MPPFPSRYDLYAGYREPEGMNRRGRQPDRYGREYEGRNRPAQRRGYGGDYWWMANRGYREHGRQSRAGGYDQRYREFHEGARPRYSPIGGMHHAMGGEEARGRRPVPLAYDRWFSDWTRWF